MQILDLGFAWALRASSTREHARQTINGLLLPRAHLIWMHHVLCCNLWDRSVITQRLKRNLGLKSV